MPVAIAALLAAASAAPAQAPQVEPARFRSLTALRVMPDGDEDAPGQASDAVARPVPEAPAPRSWYSLYPGNHFGLLVDAGVPGGVGLSGMFRPWSFLRLEAGANWDYLSFGLRGGVTVIPFEWGITPTLHFEGGHYFPADASRFSTDRGAQIVLQRVPADYLSASLGLELGSQQRFVFFLRMGLSWIWSEADNLAAAINAESPGTAESSAPAPLLLRVPTVSVGVLLFLF